MVYTHSNMGLVDQVCRPLLLAMVLPRGQPLALLFEQAAKRRRLGPLLSLGCTTEFCQRKPFLRADPCPTHHLDGGDLVSLS